MAKQMRVIQPRPNNGAAKIEMVSSRQGFKSVNKQQGTTRVIFDTLELAASAQQQTLNFFQNVNTRKFPFANLNENKLQTNETIAIERVYLFLLRNSSGLAPDDVTDIMSLTEVPELSRLFHSIFNIQIAQAVVTKDIYMGSSKAPFNRDATFSSTNGLGNLVGYSVFRFETPFVLPPVIEFIALLKIPAISALPLTGSFRLGLAMEGMAGIYNPKSPL